MYSQCAGHDGGPHIVDAVVACLTRAGDLKAAERWDDNEWDNFVRRGLPPGSRMSYESSFCRVAPALHGTNSRYSANSNQEAQSPTTEEDVTRSVLSLFLQLGRM